MNKVRKNQKGKLTNTRTKQKQKTRGDWGTLSKKSKNQNFKLSSFWGCSVWGCVWRSEDGREGPGRGEGMQEDGQEQKGQDWEEIERGGWDGSGREEGEKRNKTLKKKGANEMGKGFK